MVWQFDYVNVEKEIESATGKRKERILKAVENAKSHLSEGWEKELDDFIIIKVEGYECIAVVVNDFLPIEISQHIFPFDDNRIYPMQGVEVCPQFKRYY